MYKRQEYDDGYDDEEYDENDDYDEDDEEDNYNGGRRGNSKNGVDPKMNKMMKILMVAVAVIVAFALIFLIGKAAGVFGKRSDSQISVSNEKMCIRDSMEADAFLRGYHIEEGEKLG